jgi:Phage tail protein
VLTIVESTNVRGDTLSLKTLDASNGYVVKEIDGLDPVNATLTTSSLAQRDGAQPQNARRDTRNITMKIGLEPDYVSTTVQSLRSNLYNWFMPKSNLTFAFYLDDVLYVVASGQVETNENSMFSADPEVDISIICYDPDFYAPDSVTISEDTVSDTTTQSIDYPGTSDAGVIFTLSIDRDLTDLALYNTAPDNTIQLFSLSGVFVSGDVLTINTIPGQKGITLTRSGLTSSVLYYVDDSSVWLSLQEGVNLFRALASGDGIPYTLVYTAQYGAI